MCRQKTKHLVSSWIPTPLGLMMAVANQEHLLLLDFEESRGITRNMQLLKQDMQSDVSPGTAPPLLSIEQELAEYFAGSLQQFKTPIQLLGTPFQLNVWRALQQHVPYGETRSYGDQARDIGKPRAYRAVGTANGSNKLVIVIPCHRIIRSAGELGEYGSGRFRKQWLIDLEKENTDLPRTALCLTGHP